MCPKTGPAEAIGVLCVRDGGGGGKNADVEYSDLPAELKNARCVCVCVRERERERECVPPVFVDAALTARACLLGALLLCLAGVAAINNGLGRTPAMGYNTWYICMRARSQIPIVPRSCCVQVRLPMQLQRDGRDCNSEHDTACRATNTYRSTSTNVNKHKRYGRIVIVIVQLVLLLP